jgi:transposase-like protein
MIDFKDHRFEQDFILTGVRGSLDYPLRSRNLENGREVRGILVDPSNGYREVSTFTPQPLELRPPCYSYRAAR